MVRLEPERGCSEDESFNEAEVKGFRNDRVDKPTATVGFLVKRLRKGIFVPLLARLGVNTFGSVRRS